MVALVTAVKKVMQDWKWLASLEFQCFRAEFVWMSMSEWLLFIKCAWQRRALVIIFIPVRSASLYCHFESNGSDFSSDSTWYLAVTLMTFSAGRHWLRVTPIRRNTPLYGKLLDRPRLRLTNLAMNYWKGQSRAPWWGWHIWLDEWSNWHSLRKGGKRPLLSQQLRS